MTDHDGARRGLSDREREIYRLRVVNRLTEREIGERFGITQPRVSQILAEIRHLLPVPDLAAVRAEALALHEQVQRMALELAEMEGAPVTAGKDGTVVYDPDTDTVVRDYAGRVNALRLALEADREIRKLLGADAATKVESTATIKYELEGINTDALK